MLEGGKKRAFSPPSIGSAASKMADKVPAKRARKNGQDVDEDPSEQGHGPRRDESVEGIAHQPLKRSESSAYESLFVYCTKQLTLIFFSQRPHFILAVAKLVTLSPRLHIIPTTTKPTPQVTARCQMSMTGLMT